MLSFTIICAFILLIIIFAVLVVALDFITRVGHEDGAEICLVIVILMAADLGTLGYIFYTGAKTMIGAH